MIVATGDPRLMESPDDWSRLPSCSALPANREVFGFVHNGARWIVGWNGSWMVRFAGRAGRGTSRPADAL
jgi:hypothetical protein